MKDEGQLYERYSHFLSDNPDLAGLVGELDALRAERGLPPHMFASIRKGLQEKAVARNPQDSTSRDGQPYQVLRRRLVPWLDTRPGVRHERGAPAAPGRSRIASVFGLAAATVVAMVAAITLIVNVGDRGTVGRAPQRAATEPTSPAAQGSPHSVLGAAPVRGDACARDTTAEPVTRREDHVGEAPTLTNLGWYNMHTPHVAIATVERIAPGRWDTADGCEPENLREPFEGAHTSGITSDATFVVEEPFVYRPVSLQVERVVANRFNSPQGAEYRLYGGTAGAYTVKVEGGGAPVQTLKPGRRYLLYAHPLRTADVGEDGTVEPGTVDVASLMVTTAFEIDPQGRVLDSAGSSEPLQRLVRDIEQAQAGVEGLPLEEYHNRVRFGGITYISTYWPEASALTEDDLGPEFARVEADVNATGPGWPEDKLHDGDSTGLKPGTPVYRVKGYRPEFRLAARAYGRIYLYQAAINPEAKTGADMLDIRGKVRSIEVVHWDQTKPSPVALAQGEIKDQARVEDVVDMALTAPVVGRNRGEYDSGRGGHDMYETLYQVTFQLKDGASVAYNYWPDSAELTMSLVTVIQAPEEFRRALETVMRK